jgi:hypothetical protein
MLLMKQLLLLLIEHLLRHIRLLSLRLGLHLLRHQELLLLLPLLVLLLQLEQLLGQRVVTLPQSYDTVQDIQGVNRELVLLLLLDELVEIFLLLLRVHRLHVLQKALDQLSVLLLKIEVILS